MGREAAVYLIAPMDDDPPPDYVAFVTEHRRDLRGEASRLVGGDAVAAEIYSEVLIDLAAHWRRLRWWGRITRTDATSAYLRRRLVGRAGRWRDEQIYPVEVLGLRPPPPVVPPIIEGGSLALRKAEILRGTTGAPRDAVADAGIAWVHAWRRSQWRQIVLRAATGTVLIVGMLQYFTWLGTHGP